MASGECTINHRVGTLGSSELVSLANSRPIGEWSVALPPGSSTDSHSAGAPYWGAQQNGDQKYPNSPVAAGVNRVEFNATFIQSPKQSAYVYDPARMLGIQFHVPTNPTAGGSYSFTISNITFIKG